MKPRMLKISNTTWLHTDGRIYQIHKQAMDHGMQESAVQNLELRAPFSCKILKLHVQQGQKVSKGDAIIVVEAMKMEYTHSAPVAGIVKRVLVSEAQIVSEGTLFVELE